MKIRPHQVLTKLPYFGPKVLVRGSSCIWDLAVEDTLKDRIWQPCDQRLLLSYTGMAVSVSGPITRSDEAWLVNLNFVKRSELEASARGDHQ